MLCSVIIERELGPNDAKGGAQKMLNEYLDRECEWIIYNMLNVNEDIS